MTTIGTVRTFESVKIKFGHAYEIAQTDRFTGQVIRAEHATETKIVMDSTLELRGLEQGFCVIGLIHQKAFPIEKLERKLKAALVAGLPKRIVCDFFKIPEITIKKDDVEIETYEANSTIDDMIAPTLEAQAKAGNEAEEAWNAAIKDLDEGLREGYPYNRDKIQKAMMFLEWCNQAANHGMMTGWCNEKLGDMRRGLANLAQRKNSNHSTYSAIVSEIRGHLFHWPVVNSWHQHPPRRPSGH